MNPSANKRTLERADGFDAILGMMKMATEESTCMYRAGLTFVLGDISNDIGRIIRWGRTPL